MSQVLEWRELLESAHKQLQDAMTDLITNKNYSEAERRLHAVGPANARSDRRHGWERHQVRLMDMTCRPRLSGQSPSTRFRGVSRLPRYFR